MLAALLVGSAVYVPLLPVPDAEDVYIHREGVDILRLEASPGVGVFSHSMIYVQFVVENRGSEKPPDHIRVYGIVYGSGVMWGEDIYYFYNATPPGIHSGALLISIGDRNISDFGARLHVYVEGLVGVGGGTEELVYDSVDIELEGSGHWRYDRR